MKVHIIKRPLDLFHLANSKAVEKEGTYDSAITKLNPDEAIHDKDSEVRHMALRHPKVTTMHLDVAMNDKDPEIRSQAVRHKLATHKHISKGLEDSDPEVRMDAVANKNASSEHIHKALKDSDDAVRAAAAYHKNATKEHLDIASKDSDSYVRSLAAKNAKRLDKKEGKKGTTMKEDIQTLVTQIVSKEFVEAQETTSRILAELTAEKLQERKQELAGSLFPSVNEETEELEEARESDRYIGTVDKDDPDYEQKVKELRAKGDKGSIVRGRGVNPESKAIYAGGRRPKTSLGQRSTQDIKPEHATRVDVYGRKGVKALRGQLNESVLGEESKSEWETRHDEFVSAGKNATPEHIHSVLAALKDHSIKADSKRGIVNSIFGNKSNGDLSRSSYAATHLHKLISANKNAKHDTEERKELGQHLTYAKSLLERDKLSESSSLDVSTEKPKTITVRHETSGKELSIREGAKEDYAKRGYKEVK